MFEKIKAGFSKLTASFGQNIGNTSTGSTQIVAQKRITTNLVGQITDLTAFQNMSDNEVYAQFLAWEPEIGGAIDRISTLVAQSVVGCTVKMGKEADELETRMLMVANEIMENVCIQNQFEALAEMLMTYGNAYLAINDDNTLTILPTEYVSFVKDESEINNVDNTFIHTYANYLVVNERGLNIFERKIYPKNKFIHIKYKDTPQICTDIMGRRTYGIYAISPLHRTVLSVWWKRQITILDVLARSRSIPREHHSIKADVYSLDKYDGASWAAKRAAAKTDAETMMSTYVRSISEQAADQGYVTLDTVDIKQVGGEMGAHMEINALISQIEDHIWTALNVPPSTVNGKGAGSYASELVVSNYVSSKVVQIAKKIKPAMLFIIRERLKQIDPAFPVEKLDIKIELTLAASAMEAHRQLAIDVATGLFTEDELREEVGKQPRTETQKPYLPPKTSMGQSTANIVKGGDERDGNYPDTPESDEAHQRDESNKILRNVNE